MKYNFFKKLIVGVITVLFLSINISPVSAVTDDGNGNIDNGGSTGNTSLCSLSNLDLTRFSSIEMFKKCCDIEKDDDAAKAMSAKCKQTCSNSNFKFYTSTTCTNILLGAKDIQTDDIFIKQNPWNILIVVFQIFLGIVVVVVVARVIFAGLKVAGTALESENKADLYKRLGSAAGGLVLSFSSLGITNAVKNIVNPFAPTDLLKSCEQLKKENADPALIRDCELIIEANNA